jgi:hypothetical protein
VPKDADQYGIVVRVLEDELTEVNENQ